MSAERDLAAHLSTACRVSQPPAARVHGCAGYDDVLLVLQQLILWPHRYRGEGRRLGIQWQRGCMLHGPPGVGKTSLVRAAAAQAGAEVFEVTAATITGAFLGESERRLRETFARAAAAAAEAAPAVVFIDEIDALCPRRGAASGHSGRIVTQLLALLDGTATDVSSQAVRVIAATNRPGAVDAALRRPGRLTLEIAVPLPNAAQRTAMLAHHTAVLPLAQEVSCAELASACRGFTGADIAAVCREAAMAAIAEAGVPHTSGPKDTGSSVEESGVQGCVTWRHFEEALQGVKPSLMRGMAVETDDVQWSDVGGLPEVKQRLRQSVEWPVKHSASFARIGLHPPRGILMHGPPGCSKTTLARAVATASGANMIPLDASSLYSMFLGEGEAMLRSVFKQARLAAPSIIFLDELDALFASRDAADATDATSLNLLSTLLTEMDGLELATGVLVLAATNRPMLVDGALLRPGRFDVLLYVPPPDLAGRLEALHVHTRGLPLDDAVDLPSIAAACDHFTGAEIRHLCNEAALRASQRIDAPDSVAGADFADALGVMQPALTPEVLEQYAEWARQLDR